MKHLQYVLLGLLFLVAACANDLNPIAQARVANDAYQAAGHAVLACLQNDACNKKAGDELRTADTIAYSYVTQATQEAQAWFAAPEDQKPAKVSAFQQILTAAQNSVNSLTALLQKYTGGN